jgi:hypothetical protein
MILLRRRAGVEYSRLCKSQMLWAAIGTDEDVPFVHVGFGTYGTGWVEIGTTVQQIVVPSNRRVIARRSGRSDHGLDARRNRTVGWSNWAVGWGDRTSGERRYLPSLDGGHGSLSHRTGRRRTALLWCSAWSLPGYRGWLRRRD